MATDLYDGRKMYSGPLVFILMIPVGMVIIFFLYDFFRGKYEETKLSDVTRSIMVDVLDRDGLENVDEMRDYAERLFKDNGYDPEDLTFTEDEPGVYIIGTYTRYTSVVGELTFGIVRNKSLAVHASFKGYFNEFKETVVEKYKEDDTEDLLVE